MVLPTRLNIKVVVTSTQRRRGVGEIVNVEKLFSVRLCTVC